MNLRLPLNVPPDIAEISSGYVLTKIDELESVLHMNVDDVVIKEIKFIHNYKLILENHLISLAVYTLKYFLHTDDWNKVLLPHDVIMRDGWLISDKDIDYLVFMLTEDGHYSCIGCLTKLEIEEFYNGNIENAVFDTLKTF